MWSFCKEKGAFAKKNKWLTPTRAVSVLCVRFPPTVEKGCWSGHSTLGTVTGDPVGVGKPRASTVHITLPPDLPPALPSTNGIHDRVLHSTILFSTRERNAETDSRNVLTSGRSALSKRTPGAKSKVRQRIKANATVLGRKGESGHKISACLF